MIYKQKKVFWALALSMCFAQIPHVNAAIPAIQIEATQSDSITIHSAERINPTTIDLLLSNQQRISFDFYGNNIFRMFYDPNGGVIRDPKAVPAAQILVSNPRKKLDGLELTDDGDNIVLKTNRISVEFNKESTLFEIKDLQKGTTVVQSLSPVVFSEKKFSLDLKEISDEYFFGGGVQNGRFTHKGKSILIENTNAWTDGGVASPTPFYWSTKGYGVMFYTFKKGRYDFGAKQVGEVKLEHESDYFDAFFMVDSGAINLLNDFYQLTGNPVLLPKFGFYQGHLNAYNRDYWKEDEKGHLFEDGKRYKESQKDKTGILESLNGELDNYQFSARAAIDRYKDHDMPLGWFLPNDGYGAGYGQTKTLDGNIQNLKELGEYARKNGVEIGLWTQSDLYPIDTIDAKLQRDIVKEVRDAGVRVLKTDVAWVGAGYSFGLNGVSDVARIMPYYGHNTRPFIISLDGWAGTQRYAGIWSGDQTGGMWEYIRFHIPTYIGSGLSGQPNITSDVDGIFGGAHKIINTRDFQWKTFTPMELNMDGWGSSQKYPHVFGEPITSINRHYLKWKSELLPYTYSIAKEAVNGKPMIRAMFLEEQNDYTLGKSTQYQFQYGPYFLIAPIYQETKSDSLGNDIRNHIYLPSGRWVDYFTGEEFTGNQIINNFKSPIWKLPVFVRRGAIIPLANANNNVEQIDKSLRIIEFYPFGEQRFTLYDDDGITEGYRIGQSVTTKIRSALDEKGKVLIQIDKTQGEYNGFQKNQTTELRINLTQRPKKIVLKVGGKKVKLKEATSLEDFRKMESGFYYDQSPELNKYATTNSEFASIKIVKNPILIVKSGNIDITQKDITLALIGYNYSPESSYFKSTGELNVAPDATILEENANAYSLAPSWKPIENADFYEIEFEKMHYSYIQDTTLLFQDLKAETNYAFKIRAVNKSHTSDWKEFSGKTKSNPLLYAINDIQGISTAEDQEGQEIARLFDYDEGNMWHTKWGQSAVPFELTMDLKSFNVLDKFQYLPRSGRGNGILLRGEVFTSSDESNWESAGEFSWEYNDQVKDFKFSKQPNVRYIKIKVNKAVGDFGSGRELYVFKVPGTESYIPGDINNDRLINRNDYTSYINYTGLRNGDADFEGYVSKGDVNKNGLIDAYDISVVATQIDGNAKPNGSEKLKGTLELSTPKSTYKAGETIEITLKGIGLQDVNAFSFGLPYSSSDYEYLGVDKINIDQMDNLTNDRLHSNGKKSLYPLFVNSGDKQTLEGNKDLIIIKFRAKRDMKFNLVPVDGILVDKNLKSKTF